jgi:hypothetical protein
MLQSDSPVTTAYCSCLDAVHACGGRRDGELGSGCGKWRVMATGAQVVPAWHADAGKERREVGA